MSLREARIVGLQFRELRIPFKVAFRHAAAERAETESVWVEAATAQGMRGFGESCPRPYVTRETLETARAFFRAHEASVCNAVVDVSSLRAWSAEHQADIDANPAAWCAIELAILDVLGKHAGVPVEAMLSVPPLGGRFCYTAILGDAPPDAFHAMANRYRQMGFREYKVKLSGDAERDRAKLSVFAEWADTPLAVRADANNLWTTADEAIEALDRLEFSFSAIEEPIGAGRHDELPRIARAFGCRIVLDESFTRRSQLQVLGEPMSQWLINVRVSKMGGVLRSLDVLDAARERGVKIVVGAQVGETSLLTRAALTVAHAAGPVLEAQEGAFGTWLLTKDVRDPPLMFGGGGILDASEHVMLREPGLGSISSERR
jgi:L-alanine-DL-glutamate epimerase-like enolase superfamily enzyme